MDSDLIQCPKCGTEIEVGEVLAKKIGAEIENRVRRDAADERNRAVADARRQEQEKQSLQLQEMAARLVEQEASVKEAEARELALRSLQRELEKREKSLDQAIESRAAEQAKKLEQQIREETAAKVSGELQTLKEALAARDSAMQQAREREIELLREKRALEEQRGNLQLEYQHRLDAERQRIEESLGEKYAQEAALKLGERDRQIEGLRKALAEAKRKSEQGSMETQGEALELDLEANLQQQFPMDLIEPVPKGIRGADVLQRVRAQNLADCGCIVWEAKNTKSWNNGWIEKMKDDQRAVGANLAVIVSSVLPDGVRNFSLVDGVWISSLTAYLPLASALRQQLLQVAFARSASEGKSEKMEMVYLYLSGDEFRQKVEAIVETFVGMQGQLEKEKRAFQRLWKEREKQIQRIIENTAGMYGDIRGLIGSSIPEIRALTLDGDDLLLENGEQEES